MLMAQFIVTRLNELTQDTAIREDIQALMNQRIQPTPATMDHPSIQVMPDGLGFLGLLNGIVGGTGPADYIVAHFDDDTGRLLRFSLGGI